MWKVAAFCSRLKRAIDTNRQTQDTSMELGASVTAGHAVFYSRLVTGQRNTSLEPLTLQHILCLSFSTYPSCAFFQYFFQTGPGGGDYGDIANLYHIQKQCNYRTQRRG